MFNPGRKSILFHLYFKFQVQQHIKNQKYKKKNNSN